MDCIISVTFERYLGMILQEIFRHFGKTIEVKPIKTKDYPTAAKRPKYSVLETTKIEKEFKTILNWRLSLTNINNPK